VEFEHFLIDDSDHLDGDFDMARPAVGIGVDHFGFFVHRRPQRHRADIGERVEDHLRRRINDDFS
jgi:hypothetical protein